MNTHAGGAYFCMGAYVQDDVIKVKMGAYYPDLMVVGFYFFIYFLFLFVTLYSKKGGEGILQK